MLAVIQTGGKQYIVKAGDKLRVEKLAAEAGQQFSFDAVLLRANEDGTEMEIGMPRLEKSIDGLVESQVRDRKIRVVKFKNKIRYRRVHGHRQHKTMVKIGKV